MRTRLLALLAALALLAGACGGSSENEDRSTGDPGGGAEGDVLVVGATEQPSSIDPANVYERFASDILFNTTNRLVEFAPGETEPGPGLATEWEISEDGITYTFTLRDGVTFHDGSELTSEDVKYSLERAINVNDPDGASFLLQTRNEDTNEIEQGIQSIETPDPMTVEITLVEPNSTFLSRLNYTVASVVPSDGAYQAPEELLTGDVAAQLEQFENTSGIVGTGPYRLADYTPGESATLERNDEYWGEPAKTATVRVLFFNESAQMKNAMDEGEIDMVVNGFGPAERSSLEGNQDVTVFEGEGAIIRYIVLDVTREPFDDPAVRQAIAAVVDRQRIIEEVFEGSGEPLLSMIPSSFPDYQADYISELEANLQGEPIAFDLWYPLNKYGDTEPDVAENIARSLNESGLFEVTTRSADWESEYSDNTGVGSPYGAYLLGWYPDYFDPDDYIEPFYSGQGFLGHYQDDQMDQLIREEQTEQEEAARIETFDQIQQLAADDMPFVPLYTEAAVAYYRSGLTGVEDTMDAVQQTRWFIVDKGEG